jgi:hypothetical protein
MRHGANDRAMEGKTGATSWAQANFEMREAPLVARLESNRLTGHCFA